MPLRIGVLSNHQADSLASALRALLPEAEIVAIDSDRIPADPAARDRAAALLHACDHVISRDLPASSGPLATAALREAGRRVHLIPPLEFAGFHPDTVTVRLDQVAITGPTGPYHSRIVVAATLAGLPPEAAAELFNILVFVRLGYVDALAGHGARLVARYLAYGIDLSATLPRWRNAGCFMHAFDRPKLRVMIDLARLACVMMAVRPAAQPGGGLADPLAAPPIHPFFPALAARAGLPPDGCFRAALPAEPLTTLAFVQASMQALRRAPLASLRQVPGIDAAMAKLDLTPAPLATLAPPAGTTCLLTWHGTVLRVERAAGLLIQEPPTPPGEDSADLSITPRQNAEGPNTAEALGGIELPPGALPGTIAIRRQGLLLCAEPGRLAVPMNRSAIGPWETLLPLSTAELGQIRHILSRSWRDTQTQAPLPAALIRLLPPFMLDFGLFALDLRESRPVPDGDGFRLATTTGPRTIRPATEGPARELVLWHLHEHDLPPEAASLAGFRTTTDTSFTIPTPDEILHPPLTFSIQDAGWVFDKHYIPHPLPIGPQRFSARIMRAADRAVLLSRRLEGVLFSANGVLKDYGFLNPLERETLSPSLRAVRGNYLLDEAAWREAPELTGPTVVFYNPNLQNYFHWLLEAVLPLWIMAPYLPAGTQLLMPGTITAMQNGARPPLDHLGVLQATGLGQLPRIEIDAPICRLQDAIWLHDPILPKVPAALLQRFRDAVAALHPPPPGPRTRLYIQREHLRRVAPNPLFDAFLTEHCYTTVALDGMTPDAQIKLFQSAESIIAPHGAGLSNLLFCQPGTRVLELSPSCEFRPFFWMIGEKLGLPYAVLPCSTPGDAFNGDMQVQVGRLRALHRMLQGVLS
jgi:capsular polysaccharide biosynthesis protein